MLCKLENGHIFRAPERAVKMDNLTIRNNILAILDDNSANIQENVYLQICNQLKDITDYKTSYDLWKEYGTLLKSENTLLKEEITLLKEEITLMEVNKVNNNKVVKIINH